ncbi:unnamed protein product [Didymodactylos carnosus]|uniref:Tyrosine specific protein phosphatases domain-containing protein n=1 Tax=Didymodactylos carnosus TaxID=1234261 RepID=A0A814C0Q3_9BILA|nr:unnamed protein product [Didymodactylos carnosus]CAF0934505.1 unnamed protein product [Didymodactylos carnosus]CAF3521781.1 unnamed protein product [Didymodactylos carnosus]CAF3711964.1 unnamed protein product [Didymodactylos carnosus]
MFMTHNSAFHYSSHHYRCLKERIHARVVLALEYPEYLKYSDIQQKEIPILDKSCYETSDGHSLKLNMDLIQNKNNNVQAEQQQCSTIIPLQSPIRTFLTSTIIDLQQTVHEYEFGIGVVARTEKELKEFQYQCTMNYLLYSKSNSFVADSFELQHLKRYIQTGIDLSRLEYAMIVLLNGIQNDQVKDTDLTVFNNHLFNIQLIQHDVNETYDQLFVRIKNVLLPQSYQSVINSKHPNIIKDLPSSKYPCFVQLLNTTNAVCVTHILTILGENEKSSQLIESIELTGIQSIWLNLNKAHVSSFLTNDDLKPKLLAIRNLLLNENYIKLVIHCSAGLHRTGTICYLIFRLCNLTVNQALFALNLSRGITAREVGKERILAAEELILPTISK